MKKIMLSLAIFVCMSSIIHAEFPSLWLKARTIVENNWNLVPGKTNLVVETRNSKDNEIYDSREIMIQHELLDDGYIDNFIIEAKVNGEDIPLRSAYDIFGEMLSMDLRPTKSGIFYENSKKFLDLRETGETKKINGFNCIAFEFSYSKEEDDNDYYGVIWIDQKSGAPISRKFNMKNTPMFVNSIEIEENFHYEPSTGKHYLKETITYASVTVQQNSLKNVTRMIYDQHWSYQPK